MSKIDLHMHSSYSDDGEFTPSELVEICFKNNISVMAITDHNSISGIQEGEKWARKKGITFIPAIELDCVHNNVNLHVLGYFIDSLYPKFKEIEEDIINKEQIASKIRLKKIKEQGIYVDDESVYALSSNGVITGEMIGEVAINDKRNIGNELLFPYLKGGERSDNPLVNFYWDFFSQGKPAYAEVEFISLKEAINTINKSGGIAVLAHPGNNVKEDSNLLKSIIAEGIVGMEVFSSYHSSEQTKFYKSQAKLFNIAMTVGSDFHGKTKPKINVGSVDCFNMDSEIIEELNKIHLNTL